MCRRVVERSKRGKRFSIVVAAEGARPQGGGVVVKKVIEDSTDPVRLGGIADLIAAHIERECRLETRVTVLGHLQRGGTPTVFDRVLATRFGSTAAHFAEAGTHGMMVALNCRDIVAVPIADAIASLKVVPRDDHLIRCAESVGTSFGV